VNPRWLCLLTCIACSRRSESPRDPEAIPPGTAADSTDLSPDESAPTQWTAYLDSAEVTTGSVSRSGNVLADTGGERPRVVVRCEAGRLGVYVVMGGERSPDSAGLDERTVPVAIDSAPSC
jgi:hypothetical protein